MDNPPFEASKELYKKLVATNDGTSAMLRRSEARGTAEVSTDTPKDHFDSRVPGRPQLTLSDKEGIVQFLKDELLTPDLNKLSPHLWLVAKQDSEHISSLTHQIVQGRNVVITEDPELHLVWIYDQVFLKPIPKCLLSYAFWEFYLGGNSVIMEEELRQNIAKAALGFLRSYAFLIQHKSDFLLATDNSNNTLLVPGKISFSEFIGFISSFKHITDDNVSPRYQFGQLRLTRLNFWSKVVLQRFAFRRVRGGAQYGTYFATFYGPLLFIFAVFSVILSAMQVALAVLPLSDIQPHSWSAFARVSKGFAVFTLVCVALVGLFLLSALILRMARETAFALKDLARNWWLKRKEMPKTDKTSA